MSAIHPRYAEDFERFANRLPQSESLPRRALFDSFLVTGFPGPANEDWHYTDLAPLADVGFALGDEGDGALLAEALEGTDRLVYRNGICSSRYSTAQALHGPVAASVHGDEQLDALNGAFATGGLRLTLAQGQRLARPLLVLLQADAEVGATMIHQRHRIELGPNAEATVLFHLVGGHGQRLATHRLDIQLGRGARLQLHCLSDETVGSTLATRLDARLQRDARLLLSGTDVGAGLAKHAANVTLAEAGAEVEANWLFVPKRGAHVDNLVRITHAAPHCRSRLNGRGIVDEHAKAIFNGKVIVRPGAQKTDSEQRLANLLLSKRAEINAKPDLEIHADDVKCAHGATVGQLDEKALAYLRSRGIPRDEARALLLRAFATEILDRLNWPALRERIEACLHLPALAAEDALDWEDAA